MIEISHQQARRLLRAHLDTPIPNEQWTMLQAHLESCHECRAYAEGLGLLEKSLRRALRGGWESTPGPGQETARLALADLRKRTQVRKGLLYAGAAAIFLAAIIFLSIPAIRSRLAGSSGQSTAGSIPVTQITLEPSATLLPTVAAGQFPHIVAYESRRDGKPTGDSEIYLLNPGSQPVNLTDNPAQDTDPAWSPDGEWLAFLSDRNQKIELFVTNITSSRVIQLTNEPGVTWQGPLSWSPDGQWIALSGSRDQQGDQSWVYLAALDGSGARSLAGSRGGETPKFAPSGSWLARPGALAYTFSGDTHEGVSINHLETGEQATMRWTANPLVPPPAIGSSFEWSLDGAGLAFVASSLSSLAYAAEDGVLASSNDARRNFQAGAPEGPAGDEPYLGEPGSHVVVVGDLDESLAIFSSDENPTGAGHLQVASSRWPGAFRAVTWTPNGGIAFLEDLEDARANNLPDAQPEGCWTVQVTQPVFRGRNNSPISPVSFGGLCVVGAMQRASWTPDGLWLVVRGRLPAETNLSIFVLRMPARLGRGNTFSPAATPVPGGLPSGSQGPGQPALGTILRLVNDPWSGALPVPRPRLSPFSRPAKIDPQPAESLQEGSPGAETRPSNLSQRPGGPRGQILYAIQNNAMSVIVSANPDGTGGRVLLASLEENHCPVWSPDRRRIALAQVNGTPTIPGESPPGSQPPGQAGELAFADGIFILDTNNGRLREISPPDGIPGISQRFGRITYGCPVWSPDGAPGGPYAAALVDTGRERFLGLFPAGVPSFLREEQVKVRYISLGRVNTWSQPVWSRDGQSIFLLRAAGAGAPPGLRVIDVPEDPEASLTSMHFPGAWGSQPLPALAIAPDGKALVELEGVGSARSAHLHQINLAGSTDNNPVGSAVQLDPPANAIEAGSLTWLFGNTFGVILHGGPADAYKSMFYLYNLETNSARPITMFADRVNSATWSPDGRWLVFSAESGLWGLEITRTQQETDAPVPVWLSPQPVQDIDW